MGGMACGSTTMISNDVVQIGGNRQHVFFMLWHSCLTTTWWHSDLADDVSLFSSYFSFLHLHTSYSPQAHLQSSHCIVTAYILAHKILPASPGRAQKKSNNQQQPPSMLTAWLPNLVSPFLLTYQQLHTHSPNSRNLLSCMTNQIPWSIHKPITKDPIASKLIHFLNQPST